MRSTSLRGFLGGLLDVVRMPAPAVVRSESLMPVSRRGFLKGALAVVAAPAIVSASSLMPIFVPKRDILLPHNLMFEGFDLNGGDFTVETWIYPPSEQWEHLAQTFSNRVLRSYRNGVQVPNHEFETYGFKIVRGQEAKFNHSVVMPGVEAGREFDHVDDIRLTSGVARSVESMGGNFKLEPAGKFASMRAIDKLNIVNRIEQEVTKFEASANRAIHKMETFVDRAESLANKESPSKLFNALLGNALHFTG